MAHRIYTVETPGAYEGRQYLKTARAFISNKTSKKYVKSKSTKKINCVTLHQEDTVMINPTVLKNVGPLLRNKDGRSYKRRGVHEHE